MARPILPKAPVAPSKMDATGAPSNLNYDRPTKLKPPRIRPIATRNYGKGAPTPSAYPSTTGFGAGIGFGRTGLNGENF